MANRPVLSLVTVAFRSRDDIAGLLQSVQAEVAAALAAGRADELPELDAVVVDNWCRDGVADLPGMHAPLPAAVRPAGAADRPWVRYLPMPANVGMGAGLNAGVRLSAAGSAPAPATIDRLHERALLLINPDVRLGPGSLPGFAWWVNRRVCGRDGRPVIVGPGLVNADGSRQLSAGWFPNLLRMAAGLLRPRAVRKYVDTQSAGPSRVDWLTGACLLVSADVYADLGGFDERYFLYYEETDLCRRARNRGVRCVLDPRITCSHLHPLQDREPSPQVAAWIAEGRRRFVETHCGAWEGAVLRAAGKAGSTK